MCGIHAILRSKDAPGIDGKMKSLLSNRGPDLQFSMSKDFICEKDYDDGDSEDEVGFEDFARQIFKEMRGVHGSDGDSNNNAEREPPRSVNARSGPGQASAVAAVDEEPRTGCLDFYASVLCLRDWEDGKGPNLTPQPYAGDDQDATLTLLWNGEAWKINGKPVVGNDTKIIHQILQHECVKANTQKEALTAYTDFINGIDGPFSFIIWDGLHNILLFGRDRLGRRSLAINCRNNAKDGTKADGPLDWLEISSVCSSHWEIDNRWEEVKPGIITFVDLGVPIWQMRVPESYTMQLLLGTTTWSADDSDGEYDEKNMALRLNVSLPKSPVIFPSVDSPVISDAYKLLLDTMKLRCLGIQGGDKPDLNSSHLAILYSGGLDSSLIARIAHDIIPKGQTIDLLNVVFENPRAIGAARLTYYEVSDGPTVTLAPGESYYDICPDRKTARSSLEELRKACPGREFRLLELNIPYKIYTEHLPTIKTLIFPQKTEMDLSIGAALYFAARGIDSSQDPEPKQSPCNARVLLSGFGADELYGGYMRHKLAFQRGTHKELLDELLKDYLRVGTRNLGRDDRVISHWGREVRYPFLDETFLAWTLMRPVQDKCGYGAPEDDEYDPAKRTLRVLAAKLGLPSVAKEPKRAIQFGSRSAKMTHNISGTADIS